MRLPVTTAAAALLIAIVAPVTLSSCQQSADDGAEAPLSLFMPAGPSGPEGTSYSAPIPDDAACDTPERRAALTAANQAEHPGTECRQASCAGCSFWSIR